MAWYQHKDIQVRVGYFVIFFLSIFLAWLLRDVIPAGFLDTFYACDSDKCYGKMAVYRVCFSLSLFFGVLSVIMIGHKVHTEESLRTRIQDDFWWIKIPLLIGIIAVSLFIPNDFFIAYAYVAIFGAGFFIIIQIILLVGFAYEWNESWHGKGEDSWDRLIIFCSVVIYLGSLVAIALMFAWFTGGNGCGLNIFFVLSCLMFSIVYTYISLREDVERGALLTSSVVTAYCTYLCWSALSSEPDNHCSHLPGSSGDKWLLVVGLLLGLLSTCWATIRSASQRDVLDLETKPLTGADEHSETCYNFSYFHIVFATGAMYICMLLTNWDFNDTTKEFQYDQGWYSTWVKVASMWITSILYLWSLVGPLLCPHRDWD
eukprot:TRINITY_DN8156_c0_g1_i1.p1 TRINITY_DN8156_c0_g1~~TRINITY_DN8156_c0_g1_i1.p1  ORF type:complete len:373 (-),score=35.83 TRINITY_DN8156_c0_g1_i1:89-1207(-)